MLFTCMKYAHTYIQETHREKDFGYTMCTLPSMLHTHYTPSITNTMHMLKRRNQKKNRRYKFGLLTAEGGVCASLGSVKEFVHFGLTSQVCVVCACACVTSTLD